MRPEPRTIRSYALYGESAELPDVMHCETIAERSVRHDWELAPHRHARLHQLLLLRTGGGRARLDEQDLPLAPATLVNVPVGVVHAFRFEPGTDGFVVTLPDATTDELLAREPAVRRSLAQAWARPADPAVDGVVTRLAREYPSLSEGRALVLRGLAAVLLGLAARVAERADPQVGRLTESHLLQRFESLLEAHFRAHWRVADYARVLAVSPTHLSRVVRAATGLPASRLIEARVVREARRQLAFTHLRVASIADLLGYADPALFTRVFTRAAGCSPRAFRQKLQAPAAAAAGPAGVR